MLKQSIVLCIWFDDTQGTCESLKNNFSRYLCSYTFLYVLDSCNSVGIQELESTVQ